MHLLNKQDRATMTVHGFDKFLSERLFEKLVYRIVTVRDKSQKRRMH